AALTEIRGRFMQPYEADLYEIYICNPAGFSASTVFSAPSLNTQLFLFDESGFGITKDDDNSFGAESYITGQFVPRPGRYFLGVSQEFNDPMNSANQRLWNLTNSVGGYYPHWHPNGPGAGPPAATWTYPLGFLGAYTIHLNGTCFLTTCYANCDNSTVPPTLNANDFLCFLDAYAGTRPYANCDHSTSIPVFNAND